MIVFRRNFLKTLDQVQIRRIGRKEDLFDFRTLYPFPALFIAVITRIICDDVDIFSLGVPLQSHLIKGDGGIGIDVRTLMGYDICHIMRIEESVDVDLGSDRSRWAAPNVCPS